ncbi:MAG: hypothetical protein HKN30_13430 [Sulfitobacter sp.]|nr:hypothetical protein [Sulfitobacter sp.]
MQPLTLFFYLFIGGALGLKAAVISGNIHPVVGIICGVTVGFALIRLRKSSEK